MDVSPLHEQQFEQERHRVVVAAEGVRRKGVVVVELAHPSRAAAAGRRRRRPASVGQRRAGGLGLTARREGCRRRRGSVGAGRVGGGGAGAAGPATGVREEPAPDLPDSLSGSYFPGSGGAVRGLLFASC